MGGWFRRAPSPKSKSERAGYPMLLLTSSAENWGRLHWGKERRSKSCCRLISQTGFISEVCGGCSCEGTEREIQWAWLKARTEEK